jgi:hypothetical protein
MEQLLTTVPAHFDGEKIKLDAPITLAPNTRLLVVILDQPLPYEVWVEAAMKASEPIFTRIWDNEEDAVYDDL